MSDNTIRIETKDQLGARASSPDELRKALEDSAYGGPMWYLLMAAQDIASISNRVRRNFQRIWRGTWSDLETQDGPGSRYRVTISADGWSDLRGSYWQATIGIAKERKYGSLEIEGWLEHWGGRCIVVAADGQAYEFSGILIYSLMCHAVRIALVDRGAHSLDHQLGNQLRPVPLGAWFAQMVALKHRSLDRRVHTRAYERERDLDLQLELAAQFFASTKLFHDERRRHYAIVGEGEVIMMTEARSNGSWVWRFQRLTALDVDGLADFPQKAALAAAFKRRSV